MPSQHDPSLPGPVSGSSASHRSTWVLPAALFAIFVVSAAGFATRLIRKERLEAGAVGRDELVDLTLQGGVFRYPLFTPMRTLDPAQAVFANDVMLVQQLYDGLVAFDEHLNTVPALAKFWEISPDGKTYTFELREEARFHNGREVTPEDCVFSFERLLTEGLNDHNYSYFSRIEGAEDFRAGRASHVRGLAALDDRRFQIRFETPFVPALSVLSMYSSKILPREELVAEGESFFEAPIGTGAFQFSRWIEPAEDPAVPVVDGVLQGLRLEANPQYFEGRPHLDAVVFRAIWNSPEYERDSRPLEEIADCLETNEIEGYADWVSVEAERFLALRYLYFPNRAAPYDDPNVRLAINYALDKRSFLDVNRATQGIPAATGVVPPGIPGFIPRESHFQQDLEKAKELLRKAGYPEGKGLPPLELPIAPRDLYSRDPASVARDGCVVSCLKKVGVEVKLVELGDDEVETPRPGSALLAENTWYADFPDPDNFLRPLFHSEGAMNRFGYRNEEVDRLLDQVLSETSYTKRIELYHRIEEHILRDSPIIPTDYGRLRFLLRPTVRGFKLTPLGAPYIRMKDIWLAEDGRPRTEVEL